MKAEFARKKEFVRTNIFPLIREIGGEVRYTKSFLYTVGVAIQQAFEKTKKETKVGDLNLTQYFDTKDPKFVNYEKLFAALKDENIESALQITSTFPDAMDAYFDNQNNLKQINDVPLEEIL